MQRDYETGFSADERIISQAVLPVKGGETPSDPAGGSGGKIIVFDLWVMYIRMRKDAFLY